MTANPEKFQAICVGRAYEGIDSFELSIWKVLKKNVKNVSRCLVLKYTTAGSHPIQNDYSHGSRFP